MHCSRANKMVLLVSTVASLLSHPHIGVYGQVLVHSLKNRLTVPETEAGGGGGGWILSTCVSLAIYSPHLMFVIAHQTAFIQVSLSVSLSRTLFLSLPLSLSLARSPFLSLALFLSLSDHSLFLCAVRFSPDLIPHNL